VICWFWKHRQLIFPSLALLLYLIALGRPALWEPDEGRYAEIAREMVASHDYVTPRNNFVRYFEKPPLVYWLSAAALKAFGRNEFAVRLQAALASAGQVAVTGALGEQMFGPTAGVLAAVALGLSPLFFTFAQFATPDPALAFFLSAAMACFYMGAQSSKLPSRALKQSPRPGSPSKDSPESDRELIEEGQLFRKKWQRDCHAMPSMPIAENPHRNIDGRWMVAFAAMLALGTLTKGPVALVLGNAIAVLWLVSEGRTYDVFQMPWLKCVAVYAGLTLPWFTLVAWRNPGFLRFFIIHEHFQRYLESTEHSWGPWFYVPISIYGTWPWFYFVPLALAGPGARLRFRSLGPFGEATTASPTTSMDWEDRRAEAALRFLVIWFAIVLGFFSIPRSKLGQYVLPGLPPIAILAGQGLMRIENLHTAQRRRLFMIFAGINATAAIAIIVALVAVLAPGFRDVLTGDAMIIAAVLLAAGIALVVFSDRDISTVTLALAMTVIMEIGAGVNARERVASFVSYRRLAGIIVPYASQGCRLMSYRHFEQALPFYTGVRETLVSYRGELEPFGPFQDPGGTVFATLSQLKRAWAGDNCIVLVANRSDLLTLANLLFPAPTLIGCEGKKLALYNRPLATGVQNERASPGCGDKKS
jgi:4-amino-4-deoxy-L-arabinose transferase-like glycosyltransferase